MREKSARIAVGGVFSGLCVLLMFLSGVIPFTEYMMPMIAGAMLAVIVIENGEKTAWLVYGSVSLLCVFIVPDLYTKLIFILFFGYYTILKSRIERLRINFAAWLIKLALFNASMIVCYLAVTRLFGLAEVMEDMQFFGKYGPPGMLAVGNVGFFCYDFLVTRYISIYLNWFRPTFLRK